MLKQLYCETVIIKYMFVLISIFVSYKRKLPKWLKACYIPFGTIPAIDVKSVTLKSIFGLQLKTYVKKIYFQNVIHWQRKVFKCYATWFTFPNLLKLFNPHAAYELRCLIHELYYFLEIRNFVYLWHFKHILGIHSLGIMFKVINIDTENSF